MVGQTQPLLYHSSTKYKEYMKIFKDIKVWFEKFFEWHENQLWSFASLFKIDWYVMCWIAFFEGIVFTLIWIWILS